MVYALVEYETYKLEEDNGKDDFQSAKVHEDPVLESFYFDENAKLSILDVMCWNHFLLKRMSS